LLIVAIKYDKEQPKLWAVAIVAREVSLDFASLLFARHFIIL